jgi:hypothetical protein
MQKNKNNKMKNQKAFCNYVKVFCYLLMYAFQEFPEFLEKQEIKNKDMNKVFEENIGDEV